MPDEKAAENHRPSITSTPQVKQKYIDDLVDYVACAPISASFDKELVTSSNAYQARASRISILRKDLSSLSDSMLRSEHEHALNCVADEMNQLWISLEPSDVQLWARMGSWDLNEAIAISLGIIPNEQLSVWSERRKSLNSNAHAFSLRSDLVQRALRAKLIKRNVKPTAFIRWARDSGLNPPSEIVSLVLSQEIDLKQKYKEALEEIKFLKSELKLSNSPKLDTAYKIIGAMAIDFYNHNKNKKKNGTVTCVQNALDSLGVSISDRTIREYINASMGVLPKDCIPVGAIESLRENVETEISD